MNHQQFFFEMNLEVCSRSGERLSFHRTKIRSAMRIVNEFYYLMGPDLVTGREEMEIGNRLWGRTIGTIDLKSELARDPSWKIPGEPRTIFANYGKKIDSRFYLYELWEDSGLMIMNSGWEYVEPLMFSHGMGVVLERLGRGRGSAAIEALFGNVDLCVKRKHPEIQTLVECRSRIHSKPTPSGMDIMFETARLSSLQAELSKLEEISSSYSAGLSLNEYLSLAQDAAIALAEVVNMDMILDPDFDPSDRADMWESPQRPPERKARFLTRICCENEWRSGLLWILD